MFRIWAARGRMVEPSVLSFTGNRIMSMRIMVKIDFYHDGDDRLPLFWSCKKVSQKYHDGLHCLSRHRPDLLDYDSLDSKDWSGWESCVHKGAICYRDFDLLVLRSFFWNHCNCRAFHLAKFANGFLVWRAFQFSTVRRKSNNKSSSITIRNFDFMKQQLALIFIPSALICWLAVTIHKI